MQYLTAPSAALVSEIHVARGDIVPAGARLLSTELMKMSHVLRAEAPCRIEAIHVAPGDALTEGQRLMSLAPAEAASAETRTDTAERPERTRLTGRLEAIEHRPEATARRQAKGLRTARDNVADLLDPGSFTEYGALATAAQRTARSAEDLAAKTPADGIITGTGTVEGRPIAVLAVDYTVLAGTQGYFHHRKIDRLLDAARDLPLVLYAEGGGGRPGDVDADPLVAAGLNLHSFAAFAAHEPFKIGIAAGYCFAGNAALWGVCDIRIATQGANIGMGGPAMIEGGGLGRVAPTDIGHADMHAELGTLDLLAQDEAEATAQARTFLTLTPREAPDHDPAPLMDVVPASRVEAYDMRAAITALTDSFLELRAAHGAGLITGIARIEGRPTALMANNPLHLGGAIDAHAAAKGAAFIALAGKLDLPLVSLIDTPGFMVGPDAEAAGQVGATSALFRAGARFGGPWVALILRKAYGLGAMAMAGGSLAHPTLTAGWPTAEIGAMGLEGAVKLGYAKRLAAIEDAAEREAEYERLLAAMYDRGSALNAASLLEFDAVILPENSRATITRALSSSA